MINNKFKFLILISFTLLYFGLRIPYYITPLSGTSGEDGCFADLFINNPQKPNFISIGRVNGNTIYTNPQHPAFMYEIISYSGKFAQIFVDFSKLDKPQTDLLLRIIFSLFPLTIYLFLLFLILNINTQNNHSTKLSSILFLFTIANIPLSLINSTELQVDSTIGLLGTGLLSIALLKYYLENNLNKKCFVLLILGAALIGCGKLEWSVIAQLATISLFIYLFIYNKQKLTKEVKIILITIFITIVIVNILNYIYDPLNYSSGIDLLSRMMTNETMYTKKAQWTEAFINNLKFLWLLIVIIFSALGYVINNFFNKKGNVSIVILSTLSLSFFLPFFISTWFLIRYFSPALIVATVFYLSYTLNNSFSLFLNKVIFITIIIINILTINHLINYHIPIANEVKNNNNGQIIIGNVADLYNRKDIDYVSAAMGFDSLQAEKWRQQQISKIKEK